MRTELALSGGCDHWALTKTILADLIAANPVRIKDPRRQVSYFTLACILPASTEGAPIYLPKEGMIHGVSHKDSLLRVGVLVVF